MLLTSSLNSASSGTTKAHKEDEENDKYVLAYYFVNCFCNSSEELGLSGHYDVDLILVHFQTRQGPFSQAQSHILIPNIMT